MKEQSIQFGNGLHGIHIDAGTVRKDSYRRPVFVLINAGNLNCAGPYKLYTDLVRNLAQSGYDSLRFDLAGIGNSRDELQAESGIVCQQGGCSSGAQTQAGILAALDVLTENYGAREFVLFGLCSGGDNALIIAGQDPRVVAAIPIDSAGFRAGKFHLHHYLHHYPRRLVSVSKWRNLLEQRKVAKALAASGSDVAQQAFSANDGYRALMSPESFRNNVARLVDRKCKALFVYSGGIAHYYNHESQFKAMVGDLELAGYIDVAYYPKADHLFFVTSHRQALISEITNWANSNLQLPASTDNRRAA